MSRIVAIVVSVAANPRSTARAPSTNNSTAGAPAQATGRLLGGQRLNLEAMLPAQPQALTAGHEYLQPRGLLEQLGHECRRRQEMLEVVQHEQQLSGLQVARQVLLVGVRGAGAAGQRRRDLTAHL